MYTHKLLGSRITFGELVLSAIALSKSVRFKIRCTLLCQRKLKRRFSEMSLSLNCPGRRLSVSLSAMNPV